MRGVSLEQAAGDTLALLGPEIAERGATVSVMTSSLPPVRGDGTLIQVVLQNLIENAIKFVPAGVAPRVGISAIQEDGVVRITVTYNGLGLPRDAHKTVFQMFRRYHPGYSGTGMGLRIVHRAVERPGAVDGFGPTGAAQLGGGPA